MAADPDDIIRATRAAQVVTLADAGLKTLFPAARDSVTAPEPGFFVNPSDASAALTVKAALVGVARRRWVAALAQELTIDPLTAIPTMQLKDAELAVDTPVLPTRLELDLEEERTSLEVIG